VQSSSRQPPYVVKRDEHHARLVDPPNIAKGDELAQSSLSSNVIDETSTLLVSSRLAPCRHGPRLAESSRVESGELHFAWWSNETLISSDRVCCSRQRRSIRGPIGTTSQPRRCWPRTRDGETARARIRAFETSLSASEWAHHSLAGNSFI